MNLTHTLSYTCPQCDRDLPKTDLARLIHLQRHHPQQYQAVEAEYLDAVAERNDISRRELMRETEGAHAQLVRLAKRGAAAMEGKV